MTNDGNAMERLRADLLRRAQSQREINLEQSIARDLEAQNQAHMADGEVAEGRRSGFAGFHGMALPRIFGRRNQEQQPPPPPELQEDVQIPTVILEDDDRLDTPKSPVFGTRRSTMRFTLPSMSRLWSSGANGVGSPAGTEWPTARDGTDSPRDNQQQYTSQYLRHPAEMMDGIPVPPEPVTHARSTFRAPSSYYADVVMSETGEQQPTRARDERRHKRRHKKRRHHRLHGEHRRNHGDGRRRQKKKPHKFLFCFPWVQSKAMRSHILRCFVSGLFLVILLSVCKYFGPKGYCTTWERNEYADQTPPDLGLSVTNNVGMSDFTIVLILIVILATLFFAYGLVRLCMLVIRGDRARPGRTQLPPDTIMGHYAVPDEPIRVVLARDEEASGVDSEASKVTPPAYGLWRESVVCFPESMVRHMSEPC